MLSKDFRDLKKLTFVDSHGVALLFPFAPQIAHNDCESHPEILVSFPGESLSLEDASMSKWEKISMIIQVHPSSSDDAFTATARTERHSKSFLQLARSAHNLMLAHGSLAAFVIGVYGNLIRIARFDHTAAVVCHPLDIHTDHAALRRFFWRFTHPQVAGQSVVGSDPTVSRLHANDKAWAKACLGRLGENLDGFESDIVHGRRAYVYDEQTATTTPYILYKLIHVDGRLFSRASTVWRAIEDTRARVDDTEGATMPKVRILKDSWRELGQKSEVWFHHRLVARIPQERWRGLVKLENGGDLGEREVRQWEKSSASLSDVGIHEDVNAAEFSVQLPQHQTLSWSLIRRSEYVLQERSHVRFVVEDVGRPITEFKDTRELVRALRDAIYGALHPLFFYSLRIKHAFDTSF